MPPEESVPVILARLDERIVFIVDSIKRHGAQLEIMNQSVQAIHVKCERCSTTTEEFPKVRDETLRLTTKIKIYAGLSTIVASLVATGVAGLVIRFT